MVRLFLRMSNQTEYGDYNIKTITPNQFGDKITKNVLKTFDYLKQKQEAESSGEKFKGQVPFPLLGYGKPGIGKTQSVFQSAKKIAQATGKKCNVIQLNLGTITDPGDIVGYAIPDITVRKIIYCVNEMLQFDPDSYHLMYLDEITNTIDVVEGAALNLLSDRRTMGYTLPDNVFVVASGNTKEDSSLANNLSNPAISRMKGMYVDSDALNWINDYAIPNDVHPLVVEFLTFKGDDPKYFYNLREEGSSAKAFPTPRGWTDVSGDLKYEKVLPDGSNFDMDELDAEISGAIGQDVARDFMAYVESKKFFPSMEDIASATDESEISDLFNKTKDMQSDLSQKIKSTKGKNGESSSEYEWNTKLEGMKMGVMYALSQRVITAKTELEVVNLCDYAKMLIETKMIYPEMANVFSSQVISGMAKFTSQQKDKLNGYLANCQSWKFLADPMLQAKLEKKEKNANKKYNPTFARTGRKIYANEEDENFIVEDIEPPFDFIDEMYSVTYVGDQIGLEVDGEVHDFSDLQLNSQNNTEEQEVEDERVEENEETQDNVVNLFDNRNEEEYQEEDYNDEEQMPRAASRKMSFRKTSLRKRLR